MVSGAMENSFSRVLQASDVTVRKIKQTFNEKKQFWDNVIKMNADMSNIELKKEFYVQLRNSEDSYYTAIDHQKDKHKPYRALIEQPSQTHPLREYQATNLAFEQQVNQTSQQQWGTNGNKVLSRPLAYSTNEGTVLNQFVQRSAEGELLRGQ